MTAETLLNQLHKVRKNGNGKWMACCPAHDDKSPSLAITETSENVLIHCFAGCEPSEILASVGLSMADLFPQTDQHSFDDRPKSWSQPKRESRGESEITKAQIRYLTAEAMAENKQKLTTQEKRQSISDFEYLRNIGKLP